MTPFLDAIALPFFMINTRRSTEAGEPQQPAGQRQSRLETLRRFDTSCQNVPLQASERNAIPVCACMRERVCVRACVCVFKLPPPKQGAQTQKRGGGEREGEKKTSTEKCADHRAQCRFTHWASILIFTQDFLGAHGEKKTAAAHLGFYVYGFFFPFNRIFSNRLIKDSSGFLVSFFFQRLINPIFVL